MKYINLTQNKKTLVDDDDYNKYATHNWFVYLSSSNKYYACRNNRAMNNGEVYMEKLHRTIMGLGRGGKSQVDHINGDSLDNRKCNLRIVNSQQNAFNRKSQSNNKTGYKGVYKHTQYDKYVAQIKVGSKRYSLGVFDTAKEAAKAYDLAAKIHHGEFAWKNLR